MYIQRYWQAVPPCKSCGCLCRDTGNNKRRDLCGRQYALLLFSEEEGHDLEYDK